jgi:hypothetical protein
MWEMRRQDAYYPDIFYAFRTRPLDDAPSCNRGYEKPVDRQNVYLQSRTDTETFCRSRGFVGDKHSTSHRNTR